MAIEWKNDDKPWHLWHVGVAFFSDKLANTIVLCSGHVFCFRMFALEALSKCRSISVNQRVRNVCGFHMEVATHFFFEMLKVTTISKDSKADSERGKAKTAWCAARKIRTQGAIG